MPLEPYIKGCRCISLVIPDSSLALRMTGKTFRVRFFADAPLDSGLEVRMTGYIDQNDNAESAQKDDV